MTSSNNKMGRLTFKDGLSIGLIATGWGLYTIIGKEAPHLLITVTIAGVLAGIGMGIVFWKFLDDVKTPKSNLGSPKKRKILFLALLCVAPVMMTLIWILVSERPTRLFLIGMAPAMFVTSIFVVPKQSKDR